MMEEVKPDIVHVNCCWMPACAAVQLIGGVYGYEKWRLFQTSDFFVLPTHSENFGLAIAESLASGTPVITTVGTPWNDLNDSNSGAWIEIGTQPLAETLRKFLALSDEDL